MTKPLKAPLLFPDLARRRNRKLMGVAECGDIDGKAIRFECRHCGFETAWLKDKWSVTRNRYGHPCPRCNSDDPSAQEFNHPLEEDE